MLTQLNERSLKFKEQKLIVFHIIFMMNCYFLIFEPMIFFNHS